MPQPKEENKDFARKYVNRMQRENEFFRQFCVEQGDETSSWVEFIEDTDPNEVFDYIEVQRRQAVHECIEFMDKQYKIEILGTKRTQGYLDAIYSAKEFLNNL